MRSTNEKKENCDKGHGNISQCYSFLPSVGYIMRGLEGKALNPEPNMGEEERKKLSLGFLFFVG